MPGVGGTDETGDGNGDDDWRTVSLSIVAVAMIVVSEDVGDGMGDVDVGASTR